MLFLLCLITLSYALDIKGKVSMIGKPQLVTDDFVDISIVILSSTQRIVVPRYKNGTFIVKGLEDGKYRIYVEGPQLLENGEVIEIVNQTVISRKYDKYHNSVNLVGHPIDFTEEKDSFDYWSLIKNPMIIMALVSLGLIGFSKLSMSAIDEEESRMMKHPDIILPNGQRVDPTTLVPKFIKN
ncbi:hypothetical protein CL6EHI_174660 [Entamoeba histolytica]|uniref:ER membrane protein complex subunit 7 beta-sandwich domain-containing protein n=4 Tax=Entamoeba histolytica TaxID=5759 RepID=C4LZL1_ENTH1|nr:hypothetical protein EHI_174660 [Entamoeba histolytica HM-1:IMSS]EAL47960.2 hypothetical protein EHI_174660 [Entamoeba histolytica HM-1:IMSS]EMD44405.1 Hypothetical protein EHI5A_179880 [Entamoeba histolytica KU27]ENY63216.1 hypothetical protein EHI7A_134540 [Entamoeba histolytica HM-1:IMSS-A]GAT94312.1 hypothetical protein CL6EHI_174660 [Entamoeba histolytica]|eukprot:XP_653347.2 hypothetical protein EHI_174660 [Entamoeba histolytica HM-1:IMSS]